MSTVEIAPARVSTGEDIFGSSPIDRNFVSTQVGGGADSLVAASLRNFVIFCCVAYLSVYALEAPIRYGLYLASKDAFILIRDVFIIAPLALLFVFQAVSLRIHPVFLITGLLFAFHGIVFMGTIGSPTGVVYAVKILINLVLGFFVAAQLTAPGRKTYLVLAVLWCLTLTGVLLDKFVLTFPWTGIKTIVGDLSVDVSKDWQIQDELSRRVAGFTRSSIAVAVFLPPLAIVLADRIRNWFWRTIFFLVSLGAVGLTTQKGALIAFLPIAAILCLPSSRRLGLLRFCGFVFLLMAIGVPLIALNLNLDHGSGVFSTESLHLRINYTWPEAWDWIDRHQMLIFGVGLGGIGGPQRFYAPNEFNPADNLFVLAYGYFGAFAILYLVLICYLTFRPITGSTDRAATAIAMIAFAFGYGTVLSVIEDQSAGLLLGAAVGTLWLETRTSGRQHFGRKLGRPPTEVRLRSRAIG